MPKLPFFFAVCLLTFHAQAQDTIKITHPIPLSTLDTSRDHSHHQITGKALILPPTPFNSPFKYLKLTDNKPVVFDHTFFYLAGNLGLLKTPETLVPQSVRIR